MARVIMMFFAYSFFVYKAYAIDISLSKTLELNNPILTSFNVGMLPSALIFAPSGKYVYILNQGDNTISEYSYNSSSGEFTPLPISTISTHGVLPSFGGTFDPTGKFLYILNSQSNSIAVFLVNDGQLEFIKTINTPGNFPFVMTFSPNGKFAYVTLYDSNIVLEYNFNPVSGDLMLLTNTAASLSYVSTGVNPVVLTFSPDSSFAYVANYGGNSIDKYNFDKDTGELVNRVSIVTDIINPFFLEFDPTGKYAYAISYSANLIYQYALDTGSGGVIPLSLSTINTGVSPNTFITFSPDKNMLMRGILPVIRFHSTILILILGSSHRIALELCQPELIQSRLNLRLIQILHMYLIKQKIKSPPTPMIHYQDN